MAAIKMHINKTFCSGFLKVSSFSYFNNIDKIGIYKKSLSRSFSCANIVNSTVLDKQKYFHVHPKKDFFLMQSNFYHSLNCNTVNNFLMKRREKSKLLPISSSALSNNTLVLKRSLSFAWLDSLAVSEAKWFQSISCSQPVEGLMGAFQMFHDLSHLPWWMSIVLSTVALRSLITLPMAVYQNYIFAKIELLKQEMDGLIKELKRETAIAIKKFEWTESHARRMYNLSARRIWKELIIRDNCHPFKTVILHLGQIPLWICMSMALRNMASMMPHQDIAAQVLFMELSTGGFLWIPNLTDVDHSLILPFAMGLTNLLIIEVNALSRTNPGSRFPNIFTNCLRVFSIAIIPIAATVPSGVILYWVTSSMCGLLQNIVLLHPSVRRVCRIPLTPTENANPYQHMFHQFKKKFTRNDQAKS